MNWLLDGNELIALAHQGHADHPRLIRWLFELASEHSMELATLEKGIPGAHLIP